MATPDPHVLADIHRRLLDADPTAPVDLAELVLEPLAMRLRTRYPALSDPSLVDDAVADAVLDYAEKPMQFNPSKRGLLGYLEMSAHGDLKNAMQARQRRQRREGTLDVVELPKDHRKRVSMSHELSPRVDEQVVSTLTAGRLVAQLRRAAETPADLATLQLMVDGERSTERYAEVLGLSNLSVEERKRSVKRHKDRLKKRLERLGVDRND